ncbi:IMPACT family protein [Deinococcus yavapaiensis]|uniref:Putative YigZ family protein n=1 Tax=Deinococcus yavapaiensis KR-236 TaxID=694435 RepID=A0A318SB26_9DEIO|nr:YigZ family protein [Deinococcus yavapaiensis]PYE55772.1 putative YigZ family protein [Deinococcus yavapaiensis KR-236]
MTFRTLAAPHEHAEVISGSEFLAYATRADSPDAAMAFLAAIRVRHPDATHHCWAYKVESAYRFSDDGEPGGTAGAPILRALEGQGVDHVMVVVVRYFGGVKLGAGGLVRAYGGAAAEVVRTAPKEEVKPRAHVTVTVGFEFLDVLYRLLPDFDVKRGEERYGEGGLTLSLDILQEQLAAFETRVRDATRGAGVVSPVN